MNYHNRLASVRFQHTLPLKSGDWRFVDEAHYRGMRVYVYPADQAQDMVNLQQIGVDAVFTGFPERVIGNYAQGADQTR